MRSEPPPHVLAAFAFARFSFRGKGVFMLMMLFTQFIPGAMMLIPLFVWTVHTLGALDPASRRPDLVVDVVHRDVAKPPRRP